MKSWTVYEHVSPSGKTYVGITCQKPERRWKGGFGYVRPDNHQRLFANAILKYGWDNIEHKIIASNLTKIEADTIEKALIAKYKRLNKSYNITDGGDGGLGTKHTEETRAHLSKLRMGRKEKAEDTERRINLRIANYSYYVVAVKPGVILTFTTSKEAANVLGIKTRNNISSAIAGKQCLVKGYIFVHWDKNTPIDEEYLYDLYDKKVNSRYNSERRNKICA